MRNFNIGDRVAAVYDAPQGRAEIFSGDCGTVCLLSEGRMIGVRWDKNVGGHNCSGNCERGHGWKVYPEEIVLIEEEEADFDIGDEALLSII